MSIWQGNAFLHDNDDGRLLTIELRPDSQLERPIPPRRTARSFVVCPVGRVIYTRDCLAYDAVQLVKTWYFAMDEVQRRNGFLLLPTVKQERGTGIMI